MHIGGVYSVLSLSSCSRVGISKIKIMNYRVVSNFSRGWRVLGWYFQPNSYILPAIATSVRAKLCPAQPGTSVSLSRHCFLEQEIIVRENLPRGKCSLRNRIIRLLAMSHQLQRTS